MPAASANSESEGEEDQQQQKPSFASASQHFAEYFFQAGIADDATLFLRRVLQPEEIQTPKKADPTIRASLLALTPEKVDSYVRPNPSGTESVAAEAEEDNELTGSEALLQQVMATIDKFDREREEASKDIARTWNDKHFRRTNIQLPSMRSASYTDLKLANDRNGRTNQQLGSTVTISEDTSSSDETGSEKRTAVPFNSIMSSRGFSSPALGRGNSQRSKSLSATQSLLEPAFTKHLTTELPSQTASKDLEEIGEIDDKPVVPKIEEIVSASKPELASSTSIASLRNHPRSNPPPNPPPHRFFPKTSSIFHQSSPGHPPISLSTRRHPIEYKYYPEVISSFPCPDAAKLRNKDEKKDNRNGEGLPRYLSMFCFPNDISLVHECEDDETEMDPKIEAAPRNSKCDTRWHSFVITEDANTKFYGVCITIWERLSPSLQLQLDDWCKAWREDNVSDSDIEYVNHVRGQIQQEQSLIALARGRIKNASAVRSKTQTDTKQEPNVSSPTSVSTNTNKEPSAVAGDSATQNDANIETAVISTSDPKLPLPPNPSESSRDTSSVPGPIEKSLPPLPNEDIANEEKQAALQSIAESEEKILLYRELLKPFQNTMFVDSRRISVPRVIGIVSRWPWYEVLKEWITGLVLGTDAETPGGSIESHIVNLLFEVPVPPPGKLEVSLKCPGFPNRRLYCSRPALNEVPIIRNISFYPFFRALSHMNIIRIFETALTEGKIIFVSSHLSMLGLAAEVVSYLLFPLKFQGICVPVLPSGLLEYLEAPVPYIVGVGRDWWDGGKNGYNGIEDACIVDLDTNTLTYTGNPGHLTLPPKHRRKLFAQLNKTAPLHNLGVPYGVPENMKKAIPHGRNSVTESRLGHKIDPAPSLSRRSSLGDSISTSGTSVTGLDRRKSIRSLVKPDYEIPPSPNDPPKSSSQSRPEHPRGPRPFPVHQPTPVLKSSADKRSSLSMPTMQAWKKSVGAFSRKGGGGGGRRQELFPTDDTKNQKGSLPAFFGKNSRESPMFATSGTLDSVPVVASAKRRRSLDPSSVPLPSSQTSSSVNMDQYNDGKSTVDPSCSDEQSGREKETETASLKTSTIASSSAGPLVSPNSGDGEVEVIEKLPALPPSALSSVDDTGHSNANGSDLSIDDQKSTAPEVVLPDHPDPLPEASTTGALPHADNSSSLSSIPLSTSYGHGSNKIISSSNSLLSIGTLPTDLSGTTNVSATDMSRLSSGPDSLPELPTRSASMKSRRSSIASYFGSPYPTIDETVRQSEERTEGHVFLPRALEELGIGPYVTNECECAVCDQPVRSDALNCDACGTSIHRKCISRCIHPCSPTSFDEPKVLESFLRLFSSLLNNYRTFLNEDAGPDDDELFRKEAFLDTVDRDARPFLTHLVESQCFAQFVLERHERSSNDYEILFFDEMVKAKANRSRLKLAKEATPFLKDPAYGVSSTYDAMSPIETAKPPESVNRWSSKNESARFPKVLLHESFPSPRPVQPLMTDEEARMLRIHTGAITRQARMAKDKLTRRQSKWVNLRTKSDLPKRTALDHKLDRGYASLRNAEKMMDTVENKRDVQIALDALESEYRELKKIEKLDRSSQDDIEAIIKQMEDTIVRLKTSLSGTQ